MTDLTPDRLAKLRRIAAETTPGTYERRIIETALALIIETVLVLLDRIEALEAENERLRREREVLVEALMPASEALADLDKSYYRVARQDPAGYVIGNVSFASLVTVIESTRKALALVGGEKGGDADE